MQHGNPTDPTNPAVVKVGSPLYDAAADRSAQVAGMVEVVRAWPANLRPGPARAAAVAAYAAGLRAVADELDPPG